MPKGLPDLVRRPGRPGLSGKMEESQKQAESSKVAGKQPLRWAMTERPGTGRQIRMTATL